VQPSCINSNFTFRVAESEPATVQETIVGDANCADRFTATGKTQLTSGSISSQPSHGTLQQTGDLAFVYRPQQGFKGSDQYAVKICGENPSGSGCSIITYEVSVQ
jgi:hypothetical protein